MQSDYLCYFLFVHNLSYYSVLFLSKIVVFFVHVTKKNANNSTNRQISCFSTCCMMKVKLTNDE